MRGLPASPVQHLFDPRRERQLGLRGGSLIPGFALGADPEVHPLRFAVVEGRPASWSFLRLFHGSDYVRTNNC